MLIAVAGIHLGVGVTSASLASKPAVASQLSNNADFVPAQVQGGESYIVDSDSLYFSHPSNWLQMNTPLGLVISSVVDTHENPKVIYIGAADGQTLYRSDNSSRSWTKVPLSSDAGAVSDIDVAEVQCLVYIATRVSVS